MLSSQEEQEYNLNILAFKAGKGCFGVELKQILHLGSYTTEEVSNCRDHLPCLCNGRQAKAITVLMKDKELFPIIDFNQILGLTKQERGIEGRATVIMVKADAGPMGLIVEKIEGLYSLSPRELYPLPQRIRELLPLGYIWGLGLISDMLLLLT